MLDHLTALGVDVLVTIGGDDTLSYSQVLADAGVALMAIPKTMDNDVQGTEYCIGFSTAITRAKELINRQRTTLGAHERIGVFRIFGRDAGFSALYTAYVTSARCVIPEAPYDLDALATLLRRRPCRQSEPLRVRRSPAEGAIWRGAKVADVGEADAFGHSHKANVGEALADELRARTGIETLASELTYDLRSGRTRFDRLDGRDHVRERGHGPRRGWRDRPDGRDPGREVRAHRTARSGRSGLARSTCRSMYNATRFRPRYEGKLGDPMLLVGRGPDGARPGPSRRGRTGRGSARARADMSSSPWPRAMSPDSSWAASAATGSAAPSWAASSRAIPRSLRCRATLNPSG